jgi:hypothetical protein
MINIDRWLKAHFDESRTLRVDHDPEGGYSAAATKMWSSEWGSGSATVAEALADEPSESLARVLERIDQMLEGQR